MTWAMDAFVLIMYLEQSINDSLCRNILRLVLCDDYYQWIVPGSFELVVAFEGFSSYASNFSVQYFYSRLRPVARFEGSEC